MVTAVKMAISYSVDRQTPMMIANELRIQRALLNVGSNYARLTVTMLRYDDTSDVWYLTEAYCRKLRVGLISIGLVSMLSIHGNAKTRLVYRYMTTMDS